MENKKGGEFEKEFLEDKGGFEAEKKEKHLKDFSDEERKMIKLMADIFVRNLLENKLCKK